MLKNYLKTAYRNIIRQKIYSVINIFGLALGLAACILVGMTIYQDFHYDDYHLNRDNIYRISMKYNTPGGISHSAETPALVVPTIRDHFPEIEKISRIYFSSEDLISYSEKRFYENNIIFADPDFFDMFTYKIIHGNKNQLLREKNTIVITQNMAEKYFGDTYPVGQIISLNNKLDLEVVGVIENLPVNSHFGFDMVVTYETLKDLPESNYLEQWGATFGSYTYTMLNPKTDVMAFEGKLSDLLNEKIPLIPGITVGIQLQPLTSIHLHSNLSDEIRPNSSIRYNLILGSIALFILLLACINFINLTTACSIRRAHEIGVRKVFGANKPQLIKWLLFESISITFFALFCALLVVKLLQPFYVYLVGNQLIYNIYNNVTIMTFIISLTLLIGILAGIYPALVLTRYQPVTTIGNANFMSDGKSYTSLVRKSLVILQFSISLILIIMTIIINRQVYFMQRFDMGFKKDQTIVINTPEPLGVKTEAIKQELNSLPGVLKTTASYGAPVSNHGSRTNLTPDLHHEDNSFLVSIRAIDYDFIDFYGIQLLAGKRLVEFQGMDNMAVAIINETTARKLGFAQPADAIGNAYKIGISSGGTRFKPEIVGVVKDFHFNSLHHEIPPLMFIHWPAISQELSVRVNSTDFQSTIKDIRQVWQRFYPKHPFSYQFLDEKIDHLYEAEKRSFRIISTFSILAIFIACLGILGLTLYTTEKRKKEIGIRKVLGATVSNIVNTISREFLRLVLIANLIAWPVGYLLGRRWLEGFPYKVGIHLSFFLIAGLSAFLIAFLSISYIVLRRASSNPVESIRYE